jgi:hypothetical protein
MSRRATIVGAIAGAFVLTGFATVLLTVWMFLRHIDGGGAPSASDRPDLPRGVSVERSEKQCGSGGCWLELTLTDAVSRTPAELVTVLNSQHETCHRRGLLDRRQVCTSAELVRGSATLSLRFEHSL